MSVKFALFFLVPLSATTTVFAQNQQIEFIDPLIEVISSSASDCDDVDEGHISCFESLKPSGQLKYLVLPAGHTFQRLIKTGDPYSIGEGEVLDNNDFAAYVAKNGSSTDGYLSINHEDSLGGVSILNIDFDNFSKLWSVNSSQGVDFSLPRTAQTANNCSGGITPWGTVIVAEETRAGGDTNGDGYLDLGWLVEINPVTASVAINVEGKQEKLWAVGRAAHENAVILSDERTLYTGEDGGTSAIYKFVADRPRDFTSGDLFVLRLDDPLDDYDPTSSTASWVQIPNETIEDRNNSKSLAYEFGATDFDNVEDVEVNPKTGQVYFASKKAGRVYRFTDQGSTIGNFETYLGGRSYPIDGPNGVVQEPWGEGNDNLVFDDLGNLWVCQDGDLSYIWVVGADHTDQDPDVRIFATMPQGAEPTGLTFSPDYRYAFMSIQHPSDSNEDQLDAVGNSVAFKKSSSIVFATRNNLGDEFASSVSEQQALDASINIFPNPTSNSVQITVDNIEGKQISLQLMDLSGRQIALLPIGDFNRGKRTFNFSFRDYTAAKSVVLRVQQGDKEVTRLIYVE
jgi:secreted PhoX family phosphatase